MRFDSNGDTAGESSYTITFTERELDAVSLSVFDKALLKECAGGDASIADRLLGLELIARRIEQALIVAAAADASPGPQG